MDTVKRVSSLRRLLLNLGLLVLTAFIFQLGSGNASAAEGKYVGALKCKSCHRAASSGDQFGKWEKSKHSKAFTTLGEADAKKIAKEKGIADPQKAEQCMKCHDTANAVPAAQLTGTFKHDMGVQCESCHGPGEKHVKARLAASAGADDDGLGDSASAGPQVIPAGEIIADPTEKTCTGCHNKESPSFKAFDFKERKEKIAHKDPRKKK